MWGKMRDSSWEGIQEMYENGEISEEQINTFIAIRNLSDEEWSQIKKDYLAGNIGKEEFEQIKQIREMPEDWTTLENGVKGIFYGVGTGVWEGLQWYLGGKLANWSFKGSKVATSAIRVGVDTAFNAMDTPYRALLDSIATGNTLEESLAERGGWQSVLTDVGIGFIGSTGGEIFDILKINKNVVTNPQDMTMAEKIDLARKQMSEYFNEHSHLQISEERLNEAFTKIIPCDSHDDFVFIAHQLTDWSDEELVNTSAFWSSYNGGTIILRPDNSVETIIHEVNHDLGDVSSMPPGGAIKAGTNTRGINEALTERLALKIAGIDGIGNSGYASNVSHLNRIVNILEKAGYIDIDSISYYTNKSAYLASVMNQIFGNDDFYDEIVKYMNIADGCGEITDKIAIQKANIYIERLIDYLEISIGG